MSVDLFDFAAERLELQASLDRLTARGALRIALKSAGLSAKKLRVEQLRVVLDKVLPGELAKCGVSDAREICARLSSALAGVSVATEAAASTDTDEVFRRLGGS